MPMSGGVRSSVCAQHSKRILPTSDTNSGRGAISSKQPHGSKRTEPCNNSSTCLKSGECQKVQCAAFKTNNTNSTTIGWKPDGLVGRAHKDRDKNPHHGLLVGWVGRWDTHRQRQDPSPWAASRMGWQVGHIQTETRPLTVGWKPDGLAGGTHTDRDKTPHHGLEAGWVGRWDTHRQRQDPSPWAGSRVGWQVGHTQTETRPLTMDWKPDGLAGGTHTDRDKTPHHGLEAGWVGRWGTHRQRKDPSPWAGSRMGWQVGHTQTETRPLTMGWKPDGLAGGTHTDRDKTPHHGLEAGWVGRWDTHRQRQDPSPWAGSRMGWQVGHTQTETRPLTMGWKPDGLAGGTHTDRDKTPHRGLEAGWVGRWDTHRQRQDPSPWAGSRMGWQVGAHTDRDKTPHRGLEAGWVGRWGTHRQRQYPLTMGC